MRTPLTGLRLLLETELPACRSDLNMVLKEALAEVDRLETTIEKLLHLARDMEDVPLSVELRGGPVMAMRPPRWVDRTRGV